MHLNPEGSKKIQCPALLSTGQEWDEKASCACGAVTAVRFCVSPGQGTHSLSASTAPLQGELWAHTSLLPAGAPLCWQGTAPPTKREFCTVSQPGTVCNADWWHRCFTELNHGQGVKIYLEPENVLYQSWLFFLTAKSSCGHKPQNSKKQEGDFTGKWGRAHLVMPDPFWDKTLVSWSRFFGQQQPFPGFSRSWNWEGSAAPSCQECHSSPRAALQWLPAVGQSWLLTGVLNWFFSNIVAKEQAYCKSDLFLFWTLWQSSELQRDQDDTLFKGSQSDDTWRADPKFQELLASNAPCIELPLESVANFAAC